MQELMNDADELQAMGFPLLEGAAMTRIEGRRSPRDGAYPDAEAKLREEGEAMTSEEQRREWQQDEKAKSAPCWLGPNVTARRLSSGDPASR